MPDAAPLPIYQDIVRPEWVDYNGHLRDAFYLLVFSYATDALMDYLGLDATARAQTGCSLYTLETHLNYLHEVKRGEVLQIHTQLIAADAKRLDVYHTMTSSAHDEPVAVNEQMLLHVDTRKPGAAPFPPPLRARVEALAAAHANLPRPPLAGRQIGLSRRGGPGLDSGRT